MFRSTLLAIAATAGMIGTTELGSNEAKANPPVRVVIGVNRPYYPVWHRPIVIGGPVYYPTPVVVTPVYHTYNVFYRSYPNQAWRVYGTFNSPGQAAQSVNYLNGQGFAAYESMN